MASPYRHEPGWSEYRAQRKNAKRRGIEWKITYPEWWQVWQQSGHWNERGGLGADRYCMARKGDQGAYEINNVMIITNSENHRTMTYVHSQESREYLGQKRRERRRFSVDDVRAIRQMACRMTHKEIAKQFGAAHQTITKIVARKTYDDF